MQLKDLVCNASMLGQFLTVGGGQPVTNDLQTQLCDLPADILQEAERLFLTQLDFTKFFSVEITEKRNLPIAKIPFVLFSLFLYLMSYSKYQRHLFSLSERPSDGQR